MRRAFIIRETGRYGKGVFAARSIARGEAIHVFRGEVIGLRGIVQRIRAGQERADDPLQIGKRTYLDLDQVSRTFNHSCDPNAALRRRSELFAIKDIPKGAEITYDYSLTVAPTKWRMLCSCGTAGCRTIIGDVLSIPKKIRLKYLALGAGQTYIKRLLTTIERSGSYRMPAYEKKYLKSLDGRRQPSQCHP